MTEGLIVGLASILALAIAAEWLAWRIHLPSILVLLVFGFIAGPMTGLIDPDALLGDLLFPIVSISVAIILFEGGLSLRVKELRTTGRVIRNLVTVGVLVTWVLTTAAARIVLGLDFGLAVLLGAILVVTGPTVIVPLLRHVRPTGQVGPTLKWEGMLNDPIGAVLAVLVFEAMLTTGLQEVTMVALLGLLRAALIAVLVTALSVGLLVQLLKREWIPDFLQSPVTLMLVVVAFTVSNVLQTESGLLTATLMGLVLANQREAAVKHIIEFKENLRVLLISTLFILLAARLPLADLARIGAAHVIFLAVLMLVIRPAAVVVSTWRSGLTWQERVFVAFVGPRGIVAAAVASVFALRLVDAGYLEAERLVPLTFLVILGTVAISGLGAAPIARWLGLARPDPQGVLFIGAHNWVRAMARALQDHGFRVRLADTNYANIAAARAEDLPTYYGSAVTEYALDEIPFEGIGRLLALTPNDEVNSLVALHFADIFGRNSVYQIPAEETEQERRKEVPKHLRGRLLFDRRATFSYLDRRFSEGAEVKTTRLTSEFDYSTFREIYKDPIPLFLIGEDRQLLIFTVENPPTPSPGQSLIALVEPADERPETRRALEGGEPVTRT